jgi:hypothetical protein
VDLDRQSIERRDFPIARRGYDPVAVDAHLRALAADVEEALRLQAGASRGAESLGSAAAGQVQSILDAAERAAADIERQAAADAARVREDADADAERTRVEAMQRAQAHAQAVAHATAILLERVESMDGEVGALVHSLRSGAGRLATDLGSVEANMAELYDAASGRPPIEAAAAARPATPSESLAPPPPAEPVARPARVARPVVRPGSVDAVASPVRGEPAARAVPGGPPARVVSPAPEDEPARAAGGNGDIDGARLVALNMALNGEPREQADRYLAENFQLADRAKLLDEVYAAIEV